MSMTADPAPVMTTLEYARPGEGLGVDLSPIARPLLWLAVLSGPCVAVCFLAVTGQMLIWGYNSKARMKDIHVPVLVIHGDRDEVIAYEFGQQIYAAANEPKAFWTIPGATHNDLHIAGRAEFPARLTAFYRSLQKNH